MSAAPDLERVHARGRDGVVGDPVAHDRAVRSMFARIARVYDFMNHALSFNRDRAWRRDLVRALDPGTDLLVDLCAGTGDLGLVAVVAETVLSRLRIFVRRFRHDRRRRGRSLGGRWGGSDLGGIVVEAEEVLSGCSFHGPIVYQLF